MTTLKDNYTNATMAYIKAFEKKHSMQFETWVDCIGGTCLFSDYYLNFHDVKHDIDSDAPIYLIFEWYDEVLDHRSKGNPGCGINYDNYVRGLRFSDLKPL